jgi:hypothetical protein
VGGSSGSTIAHNSSLTNGLAMHRMVHVAGHYF